VRQVRLIGVGPGDPGQITLDALRALHELSFVIVTEKSDNDPLAIARERMLATHAVRVPVVRVPDPPRDRSATTATRVGYETAVDDWHAARANAWGEALRAHDGVGGFLVWGDPAFYDSTIRILDRLDDVEYDVLPGISSLQLLAARHRIVLHDVGGPIHITTGRDLSAAVDAGQTNLVVMLNRDLAPLDDARLDDWQLWWGANLGTEHEALVAGRLSDVRRAVAAARAGAKASAGWVMDVFALRAPAR
jgi:precorrin-6A synthase